MSNVFIALLVAASAAAWVYSSMMRRTGSNSRSSLVVAGLTALAAFIVIVLALSFIPKP